MTFQRMLFPDFKEKALTLSYDDGFRYDIRLIEIMSKYGLKGTFNLNGGILNDSNRIHADEIKKLYIDTGNEVAVHGKEHAYLPAFTDIQIIQEILQDREIFENILGNVVTGMAYAYGGYDDRIVGLLKNCGISYSRTTNSTGAFRINDDWLRLPATCHHNDERLLSLADEFLSNGQENKFFIKHPKLFYLWGHSFEFEWQKKWSIIEEFAKKVGNREDVWYATNGEIVAYVEAFKSLQYGVDGKRVYNPSGLDVYIRTVANNKVKIPSMKTIEI